MTCRRGCSGAAPTYTEAEYEIHRYVGTPCWMVVVRTRIDELDSTIVELLNRRAKYAVEIGKHKKLLGLPVCDAAREAFVLEKVAELANELRGPLDGASVKNIFRTIIEETRKVEE